MKIFDIVAPILLVIALVIVYFLWGCKGDLHLTIFAAVVIVAAAVVAFVQNAKMKKLKEQNEK